MANLSPYQFARRHCKASQGLYKKIQRGTVTPKRDDYGKPYFLEDDPWPKGKAGRPKVKKKPK